MMTRNARRPYWSFDLDLLLTQADALLGRRGTLGAVIGAIQRGGRASSTPTDPHTDAQLRAVPRLREAQARWMRLSVRHQTILAAYYTITHYDLSNADIGLDRDREARGLRVPLWVSRRFQELSGVVLLLWCDAADRKHRKTQWARRRPVEAALGEVQSRLAEIEPRLKHAERLGAESWSWVFPPPLVPTRRAPALAFRAFSAARLLESAARPLRSQQDLLLVELAELSTDGKDVTRVVDELERACERGEPPELAERARRALQEAHRAWNALVRESEAAKL